MLHDCLMIPLKLHAHVLSYLNIKPCGCESLTYLSFGVLCFAATFMRESRGTGSPGKATKPAFNAWPLSVASETHFK